jgi:hypothetical protein
VTYVLKLPFEAPPSTPNLIRKAGKGQGGRGHWSKQREDHDTVAEAVSWVAKAARIPRVELCTIRLIWLLPGNPRVDNDSLSLFLKGAKDGLVWAGVLEDDRCQIVVEDRMRIVTGVGKTIAPAMLLEIEPLDGAMSVPDAWTSAR